MRAASVSLSPQAADTPPASRTSFSTAASTTGMASRMERYRENSGRWRGTYPSIPRKGWAWAGRTWMAAGACSVAVSSLFFSRLQGTVILPAPFSTMSS